MIDRGHLQAEEVTYDQRHTVAKMKTIDLKKPSAPLSPETLPKRKKYLRTQGQY